MNNKKSQHKTSVPKKKRKATVRRHTTIENQVLQSKLDEKPKRENKSKESKVEETKSRCSAPNVIRLPENNSHKGESVSDQKYKVQRKTRKNPNLQ